MGHTQLHFLITSVFNMESDTIKNEGLSNSTTQTFSPRLDLVRIGTANTGHVALSGTGLCNYHIGGTATANGDFDKISKVADAYIGATVKIVTPNLNKMIGVDDSGSPNVTANAMYNIALENPDDLDYNAWKKSIQGNGNLIR